MAEWYISSTKYATYSAWVTSHAYSVGDFIIPTAPAAGAKYVFRCTTAGTTSGSEPSWVVPNNSTNTSGTAVFTNVTGQSTYAWSAAAGDYNTLARTTSTRINGGDKVYISSDHSETTSGLTIGGGSGSTGSYTLAYILSVNKAGSTPPVAADLQAGAVLACSGGLAVGCYFPSYHYGITYSSTGSSSWTGISSGSNSKTIYFDTCTIYGNTASAIQFCSSSSTAFPAPNFIMVNSTVNFGAAGQWFGSGGGQQQYDWYNTTLTGTVPTGGLFSGGGQGVLVTVRATDLSPITATLVNNNANQSSIKALFEGCKIASGVTRYSTTSVTTTRDEVELINCYDGTNIISERYQPAGTLTTEFTTYLNSGAQDNVGNYSHKMVSSSNCDKYANPFQGFWLDVNYASPLGSAKTATVEISSSGSLNNDDVSLWLEYDGTSTSSLSSVLTTLPATVLTTPSALTSSAASWHSGAGTNMSLSVNFTPRTAGRLRGVVRLGKASTTIYVNPQITVT